MSENKNNIIKETFEDLNNQYQKCLNGYYDKFFEGQDIQIDNNICLAELNKMKQNKDFASFNKNYIEYKKEQENKNI